MPGEIRPIASGAGERVTTRFVGAEAEIVCSRCRGVLTPANGHLQCGNCGARFPFVSGIPILSDLEADDPGTDYKQRQIEFFDGESAEFEITRPQGQPKLYGWLMTEKFRRSVRGVEANLPGATVLTVCGGSGMDAEFLARQGANVIASDLSLGAVQRAVERGRRCGLPIHAVVADAEHLPFADRSIDIVYVHDGLHHLSDPMVGLAEMCRVARDYVLVTEPSRAAVTSLAVQFGMALKEEDAGNRVERVSAEQIAACLTEHGLNVMGIDRYAMYYQHEPGWGMQFFSRRRSARAAQFAIEAFNRVLGSLGNKLSVRAVREQALHPAAADALALTQQILPHPPRPVAS
jgi:SAM-dependent methyltransferase